MSYQINLVDVEQYAVNPENVFMIVKSIEEISDDDNQNPTRVIFSILRIYREEDVTDMDDEFKEKKRESPKP